MVEESSVASKALETADPALHTADPALQTEERFRALHEETVYPYEDPIGTLVTLLEVEFPEIPFDILKLFSKTRFFIRLKKLNGDLKVHNKRYKKRYKNFVSKF